MKIAVTGSLAFALTAVTALSAISQDPPPTFDELTKGSPLRVPSRMFDNFLVLWRQMKNRGQDARSLADANSFGWARPDCVVIAGNCYCGACLGKYDPFCYFHGNGCVRYYKDADGTEHYFYKDPALGTPFPLLPGAGPGCVT